MKCEHHPDYDPSSGEPPTEPYSSNPIECFGCVHCWQVYARHLCNYINEEDLEEFRRMDRIEKAREIILNFTRACNKEHVRRGDWACELCTAGEGWLNG